MFTYQKGRGVSNVDLMITEDNVRNVRGINVLLETTGHWQQGGKLIRGAHQMMPSGHGTIQEKITRTLAAPQTVDVGDRLLKGKLGNNYIGQEDLTRWKRNERLRANRINLEKEDIEEGTTKRMFPAEIGHLELVKASDSTKRGTYRGNEELHDEGSATVRTKDGDIKRSIGHLSPLTGTRHSR